MFWFRKNDTDNNASTIYTQLLTVGVLKNAGTNSMNIVSTQTGQVFVAQSPEPFSYDLDGNLTADGRWSYTWDAENRLISVVTQASLPASVPRVKLLFAYDYQNRRVSKVVSNFTGGVWVATSNLKFVYDGWNLLAELNQTNAVLRSYAWGLDLSGSQQGAGGIGGLLWMSNQSSNSFVAYDGNGNVTSLLNTENSQLNTSYEYGPFGELIRATGSSAASNPFRFSTKYQDAETGLYYYGRRYYSPSTGRWNGKDPLGERGGKNLYGFVNNNPIILRDALGLTHVESSQPFPGASLYDVNVYALDVNDGQSGIVTLQRITMADVEAEKKNLVHQLQTYKKLDGCKSRAYEGGFDSKYFAGENQQHQYYLVAGQSRIYADNEINYIGIGLYEAWLCDSLSQAKTIVWLWKIGKWHTTPTDGTMYWLEVGYNNYQTLKDPHDTCCRCGTTNQQYVWP